MNKDQKFVITIGRERGSGGRMVGKELARRFHIHYYDREILACASKELDVDEAYLSSIDERSMNFMQNVFPVAYGGSGAAFNYVTTEAELIGVQSRLICEFASSRSCVIVGRCADYLLRDNPNCIRIFLSSDMEDRIEHISEIYGVSKEDAKKKIKKKIQMIISQKRSKKHQVSELSCMFIKKMNLQKKIRQKFTQSGRLLREACLSHLFF